MKGGGRRRCHGDSEGSGGHEKDKRNKNGFGNHVRPQWVS